MKCTEEKLKEIFEKWDNRECLDNNGIKGLEVEISEKSAGKFRQGKIVNVDLKNGNCYILVNLNKPKKNEKNLKLFFDIKSQNKSWHFRMDQCFLRFIMK